MAATTKKLHDAEAAQEVTVYVRDLSDKGFQGALEKIDSSVGVLKGRKAWSFADFKALCEERGKRADEQYAKLLAIHAEMEVITQHDDEGNKVPAKDPHGADMKRPKMIRDHNGHIVDYVYKDRVEYLKDFEEMMGVSFTTQLMLFTTDELATIGLAPKELRAIRKLIIDAPKEPDYETVTSS